MPPIQLKSTPASAQTLTLTQEARAQVREAMRTTLASSASLSDQIPLTEVKFGPKVEEFAAESLNSRVLCCEEINGRRWNYVVEMEGSRSLGKGASSLRAVSLQSPTTPADELMSFIRSYVVPEGFPDSVTPSYVPYMTWRALKHFFGGAIGVFTTQALLSSVGVSKNRATPGAVAINWILKDGAGRVGKMLFARQGKKFDYDLKQNVAAVTSTSTRTPIYKAYARGENIGDVTAKGECVGNIADLVKSVVLHTLNRARFRVAVESFLKTGNVPSLKEGNSKESVFNPPWSKQPVVLGSRFGDAFQEPASFLAIEPLFEEERYLVTYNPSKGNIYALLKDQAKSDDVLKAAFHAHVLLHFILSTNANLSLKKHAKSNSMEIIDSSSNQLMPTNADFLDYISESCKVVSSSYGVFKKKAADQGWIMSESLLNPGRARLCELKEL